MLNDEPYLGQNSTSDYSNSEILRRILWLVVQASLFRWSPRRWHRFRIALLRAFGAHIEEAGTVRIFPTATVFFPDKLSLGPHTMVGPKVNIYNLAHVTLHRGVNISQFCHLCAGTHDYNRWSMPLVLKPIVVGENTWLCSEVFIGPGVSIGELCVVGARSVVVKDLPPRKVCVGNPCKPIKDRVPPRSL